MSTASTTPTLTSAIGVLREQARVVHRVLRVNTEGLTEEDALYQPQPGGNCLNWVVGHLVCVNDQVLPLLGQQPVIGTDALVQYKRGSAALRDGEDALPLSRLLEMWDEQAARWDAGLAVLPAEALEQPAPYSPRNNPEETVGSLLSITLFHQSYHTGQTGLLRRMAGREGAIR
jgi:hypothetical protein